MRFPTFLLAASLTFTIGSAKPVPAVDATSSTTIASQASSDVALAASSSSASASAISPYQPVDYEQLEGNPGIYISQDGGAAVIEVTELAELADVADEDLSSLYTMEFQQYNVSIFSEGPSNMFTLAGYAPSVNSTTGITNIQKRTNVRTCLADVASGVCVTLSTLFIETIARSAGTALKNLATSDSCSTEEDVEITSGGSPLFVFKVVSTRASGSGDCDTTAELDTIIGSLDKFFKEHSSICGTWCLELTHDGSWAGYISIGTYTDQFSARDCSDVGTYGSCSSGGVNDVI